MCKVLFHSASQLSPKCWSQIFFASCGKSGWLSRRPVAASAIPCNSANNPAVGNSAPAQIAGTGSTKTDRAENLYSANWCQGLLST